MFGIRLITAAASAALLLAVVAAGAGAGGDSESGFIPLFDGKTLAGWTDQSGKPPSAGWQVEDGALHRKGLRAGSLISERQFDNFELRFEWKINKGGNSGLKYRTFPVPSKGYYGCEYQILDDDNHPNGKKATTRCGALYDLYAPDEGQKVLRAVGEYNASRVVAQGTRIEHWLNGQKILEIDTASSEWKDRIAKSKFRTFPEFAAARPGPILLQDHNNEIWFRNIEIRPLSGS
jgi:hypothetical protein